MKKFKLVYWSDCRGMEIDEVVVEEFESGREVLESMIEDKVEDEDWVNYVNGMRGGVEGFENRKEDWVNMFLIGGEIEGKVFGVDFNNELNSCLVLREDSDYFEYDFSKENGCDLVNDIESLFI